MLTFQPDLKFIYSEKATKFCEIFTLLLTTVYTVKIKVKISQNFVAFSEDMNFMNEWKTSFLDSSSSYAEADDNNSVGPFLASS